MENVNSYTLSELKIELTQECPLGCIHCSTRSNRFAKSALPLDVVTRLLHEAHRMGTKKVAITGGEPLVYEGLREVLTTASSLGLGSSLYTTGIKDNNLNPIDRWDASKLTATGLGRVIFSIYAGDPEIHESITGFPSFAPTVKAVESCIHARLPVEFHFVPLRRNYLQFAAVVHLAERLGIPKVSVLRFVPHGRGAMIGETEQLRAEEYQELRKAVVQLRTRQSVQVRLGAPMNILGLGHACCDAAQDILVVNHRGRVFPCDAFKATDYPDPLYGSVIQNPLSTVWEKSSYMEAARHLHAERRNGCGSCPTGCMAQEAVREGGLQQLIQLKRHKTDGDGPEAACLVEIKAELAD
jgi:radical SAM protein with 4Fe4S-binding SPASM domain